MVDIKPGLEGIIRNSKDSSTQNFQQLTGGRIRKRKDTYPHQKPRYLPGDKAFFKGIVDKRKADNAYVKQQIWEGIDQFEDDKLPTYDRWDGWGGDLDQSDDHAADKKFAEEMWGVNPTGTALDARKEFEVLLDHWRDSHPGDRWDRKILRERIRVYKDILVRQQMGVAAIADAILKIIYENPNTSHSTLMAVVDAFTSQSYLTSGHRQEISRIVSEYQKKHEAVEKWSALYADSAGLYEQCFGRKPEEPIELLKGPMTLMFRCKGNDYIAAHNYWRSGGDISKIAYNDIKDALRSGGAALNQVRIKELNGTVAIENRTYLTTLEQQEAVRVHEERHQFNRLFRPLEYDFGVSDVLYSAIESSKNEGDIVENVIHDWLRFQRRAMGIDERARDEIISYLWDKEHGLEEIYKILADDPLYDYVKKYGISSQVLCDDLRDALVNHSADYDLYDDSNEDMKDAQYQHFGKIPSPSDITPALIEPYIDVVFRQEYRQDLRKWLDAVQLMRAKGYDQEYVLSLLFSQPAALWSSVAKRLPFKKELITLGSQLPQEVKDRLTADYQL